MKLCFLLFSIILIGLMCWGELCLSPHCKETAASFKPKKPVRLALVLGGGGSKGLAHLGAIQELEKAGIRPDLIIGCSAGAIAGAIYADRPKTETVAKKFTALKRKDFLDFSFFQPRFGLINGNTLQARMKQTLEAKNFEDLKIPLIVISTDLTTGETVELSSGDVASAVRASCSVPGFFKPALFGGRYLVDGTVSSPVPVATAKKYGAEMIIAIDVSEKLPKAQPKHFFGITKRSLEIAYRKLVEHSLFEADIVIKMDFEDVGTFSDHLNLQIFEHGRKSALSKLQETQEKLRKNSESRVY